MNVEDQRTKSELKKQIDSIRINNLNNLEAIASLEMLLTSNNNGRVKDEQSSQKFMELKGKVDEISNITNEFVTMLR